MKKIISFSVWGSDPKYFKGCVENIKLSKEIYPGWITRFYCDSRISKSFINELESNGAEVVIKEVINNDWEGLFWRFLPASEDDVSIFISRDIDSRLNEREKAAVDEWLLSDKNIHCMRDHIEHNVPILGGMWGSKNEAIPYMKQLIEDWKKQDYKGCDQDFLREVIWENYKHTILCHDRFYSGLTIEEGVYKIGHISKYDADHPVENEIVPQYVYDPIRFFGDHVIKPFPNHGQMNYGTYVGEIIS